MFLDANQHHLHSLQLKLKKEAKALKKLREDGVQRVTISKKNYQSGASFEDRTLNTQTVTKTITKPLGIMERLNLAKQEAILERKMDKLNEDILQRTKDETLKESMRFLKRLPGISTSEIDFVQTSHSTPFESGSFDNSSQSRTVVSVAYLSFIIITVAKICCVDSTSRIRG